MITFKTWCCTFVIRDVTNFKCITRSIRRNFKKPTLRTWLGGIPNSNTGKLDMERKSHIIKKSTKDCPLNFLSTTNEPNKESFINLGVYFLDKSFFSMTEEKTFSLESDYLPKYIQKNDIKAIITDSFFIDIGIPEDLITFTNMHRGP